MKTLFEILELSKEQIGTAMEDKDPEVVEFDRFMLYVNAGYLEWVRKQILKRQKQDRDQDQ